MNLLGLEVMLPEAPQCFTSFHIKQPSTSKNIKSSQCGVQPGPWQLICIELISLQITVNHVVEIAFSITVDHV